MATIFTVDAIKEEELQRPPVTGCTCAYCRNMRVYGYAVNGENSGPSHRLIGGNERHNPENIARLALRAAVPPEVFLGYVKKPGGYLLQFQGPSGFWYHTGRSHNYPGHYVAVYAADNRFRAISLCIPSLVVQPLAGIVLTHYLALTHNERDTWGVCHQRMAFDRLLPDYGTGGRKLRSVIAKADAEAKETARTAAETQIDLPYK